MAFSSVILKILSYKDMQTMIGLTVLMTWKSLLYIALVLDQEFSLDVPKNKKLLHSLLQKHSMLQQLQLLAANQALWLRKILTDLDMEQRKTTKINVDNQATIAISNNPIFHGRTKHFKLKYYFLREVQKNKELKLIYCKTEDQLADIFTKPLLKTRFEILRNKIGIFSKRFKEECWQLPHLLLKKRS